MPLINSTASAHGDLYTVHFHDLDSEATPGLKADKWVLLEGSSSRALGGRLLLHGSFFDRQGAGRCVATCTSEMSLFYVGRTVSYLGVKGMLTSHT